MRRVVLLIVLLAQLTIPVFATSVDIPPVSGDAQSLMPREQSGFAADLWTITKRAIAAIRPELSQAMSVCATLLAMALALTIAANLPGNTGKVTELVGVVAVATILLSGTDSMIRLASDTVSQMSEYGKLLLPVMTAALASQGGVTASTALYGGTAMFDALLGSLIANCLVPLVYAFLALSVAAAATGEEMLGKLRDLSKWLASWSLKTVLYIFTGYMTITGVVSGTTDATTLKAAKLAVSGMIPVVGGILSDASESVLVSGALMKNAAGIYGLLAVVAIWITPFLRIGVQYLMLKVTAAICKVCNLKGLDATIDAFSSAMGILLGMTGAMCFLLLISLVCFMKGVM